MCRICIFGSQLCFFFSSRRRHTRCALVTGVQTCALPISLIAWLASVPSPEIVTTAITIAEIQAGIEKMCVTGNKRLPEIKKWLYQAVLPVVQVMPFTAEAALILAKMHAQIGRALCRERVCQYV